MGYESDFIDCEKNSIVTKFGKGSTILEIVKMCDKDNRTVKNRFKTLVNHIKDQIKKVKDSNNRQCFKLNVRRNQP